MTFVRRKEPVLEGFQLVGEPAETAAIMEWVVRQGYPWLLGDATHPETLAPLNGKAGDPGIYIDPQSGDLVLHTGRESLNASYGDWIVAYPEVGLRVIKPVYFDAMYEIVTTGL